MNFMQNQTNMDGPPQLEASGILNLRDWHAPVNPTNIMHRDTVTLPKGKKVQVSQALNMPSDEVLALDDEELTWVANQGPFPEVWSQLFMRRLTDEIRAIAPMMTMSAFYEQNKAAIAAILTENLESEQSQEWVEYYASALRDYPIFKIGLYSVDVKYQEQIGQEYLRQFNDIKYLTPDQVSKLTTEEKYNILLTAMKESQNEPSKRDTAIALFNNDDVIDTTEAANILRLTNSSVTCGALMACPPFYNAHDNAYNTVAMWIHHCIQEKIGTNQSVWYKQAQEIELQHKFTLSGQYVKNVQGQPIGGLNTVGGFGDSQLVKSANGGLGKPMYL
ncbi:hypothetical protein D3C75_568340 [compost metagenome]